MTSERREVPARRGPRPVVGADRSPAAPSRGLLGLSGLSGLSGLLGLLVAVLMATSVSGVAPARAAGPAGGVGGVAQLGRTAVLDALGVPTLPAEYVVLVDTSASMSRGGLYGPVRSTLSSFVASLDPADRLSVVGFDEVPQVAFSGPAANARSAIGRLPATATGASTDIGAALSTAIDLLDHPDAARSGAVILLTDGRHQPPVNSPFPAETGRPWTDLAERARTRLAGRDIAGYAFALDNADAGRAGATLLRSVLPATTVLALPPGQLPQYLSRVQQHARAQKAAELLADDVRGPVVTVGWRWASAGRTLADVDPTAGTGTVEVTVTSTARRLPVELTGVRVVSTDPSVSIATPATPAAGTPGGGLPERIALAPGQRRVYQVPVSLSPRTGGAVRRSHRVDGGLSLMSTVDSPWRTVLTSEFGLRMDPAPRGASTRVHGSVAAGWNPAAIAEIVVLVALVLLFALGFIDRRRPRLRGVLAAEAADGRLDRVAMRGRRLHLGPERDDDVVVPGTGSVHGRRMGRGRLAAGARPTGRAGRDRIDLVIDYQPPGITGLPPLVLRPGESRGHGDVTFTYTLPGQPIGPADTAVFPAADHPGDGDPGAHGPYPDGPSPGGPFADDRFPRAGGFTSSP
ncbi:vWA domain-containing protein [Frankia sp. QA3]|uniref:vWA domain-containing protein n=1 Tax=Frankia sp. QA3 TaxID=710111 RepID=UPI000269C514|nr:vWA domain-containing protein [Frankia sp. QA3]EIV94368.1 Mg-chelatase subunit ChlD [Frankia sp. QA3]